MAAFTASQAKVDNGSKVVQINSGESVSNVRGGDFLVIANAVVEINRAYIGADNKGYFELVKNWPNSNQSNQPCIVIPTTAEFKTIVAALNEANALVNDNYQAMQAWQTQMGTVTFVNKDKTTTTVKTLKQIEADNLAQMNAYHPYPWAMRKVEFDAMRAANNEKYASGFVYFGKNKNYPSHIPINEGLTANADLDFLILGVDETSPNDNIGQSRENNPVINIAGVLTRIQNLSSETARSKVLLPPAEEGKRTYDSNTGTSVVHATSDIAFASETDTNKVVMARQDMWGFEGCLREISDEDPFVYQFGNAQSQSATINGVATTDDNVRPLTYFAWFHGDTNTRGKGVNWQMASEAQRTKIASDPENNIIYDDATGKFYQWTVFGASFAGMGNGNWYDLNSMRSGQLQMAGTGVNQRLHPKGTWDERPQNGDTSRYYAATLNTTYNPNPYEGIFTAQPSTQFGVECYFLVCGTVNRLNKGGNHISHNPYGAAKLTSDNGQAGYPWHVKTNNGGIRGGSSPSTCFGVSTGSYPYASGYVYPGTGNVDGLPSNREDGGYFDALTASGYGGVTRDMRYAAQRVSSKDYSRVYEQLIQGKYRGREPSFFTILAKNTFTSGTKTYVNREYNYSTLNRRLNIGDRIRLIDNNTGQWVTKTITSVVGNQAGFSGSVAVVQDQLVVWELTNDFPDVSGVFMHADVIGDPEQIWQCDDLKRGWLGSYITEVPKGQSQFYPFSRVNIDETLIRTYTDDLGATWVRDTVSSPLTPNGRSENWDSTRIGIYHYYCNARFTVPVETAEIDGVKNGVGHIFASSRGNTLTSGRELGFSLVGKAVNSATGFREQSLNLINIGIRNDLSKFSSDSLAPLPSHPPIELTGSSGVVAFKALDYRVIKDKQAHLQFAATELRHNGTDWGDDGKIVSVDGTGTMPDENGNTVTVSTQRTVEPIGWTL